MNTSAVKQLAIYLNDHRAGAEGGEALARRCASTNADNAVGDYLANTFLPEISDDREFLESVRTRFDVAPNPVKQWGARLGELVGRAKLNGGFTEPTPLGRVLDLEALIAGVIAKRQLWGALTTVPEVASDVLETHRIRADDQLERLRSLHHEAVKQAFGAGDEGESDDVTG